MWVDVNGSIVTASTLGSDPVTLSVIVGIRRYRYVLEWEVLGRCEPTVMKIDNHL